MLVDLIDRIMVKGVILYADLVISVSGIPLIGVNLRAAIAGMKTMLDYGMMEAWDEEIRRYAQENDEEETSLDENEEIIYKTFASHYYRTVSNLYAWKPGYLCLTNKRLFLFRKKPPRILFEVALEKINGLTIERRKYVEKEENCLLLLHGSNRSKNDVVVLRTKEIEELKRKIEEEIGKCNCYLSN